MDVDENSEPAGTVGAFLFAVDSLREIQSAAASLAAMEMVMLASVVDQAEALTAHTDSPITDREMAIRTATAEIGAALRVSDRTVQQRMSHAWDVSHRMPQVFEALRSGQITAAHVKVIARAGEGIPEGELRDQYEVAALERAEVTTPGRLAGILPMVAQQIHDTDISQRHRKARMSRRVEVRDTEDGMAELFAVLPAVLAHGIFDRLTSMSKSIHDADPADERSRDEIRADVLCDLALGGGPVASGEGLAAIRAHVQVTVPVLSLAGLADDGAELIGSGPIDAETARRLAGAASGWDRVMTSPVTGAILAVDRYRPTEEIRRTIRVRDEHCRFPGCRQSAQRCDIDHSHAAAEGGATCIENLALLCRRHHVLKHAAKWLITHLGNGVLQWTSPSGRTYIDTPCQTLRFYPSSADRGGGEMDSGGGGDPGGGEDSSGGGEDSSGGGEDGPGVGDGSGCGDGPGGGEEGSGVGDGSG